MSRLFSAVSSIMSGCGDPSFLSIVHNLRFTKEECVYHLTPGGGGPKVQGSVADVRLAELGD